MTSNIIRFLLLVIFLSFSLIGNAANLRLEIERETVSIDDALTFQVLLEDGSSADEYPLIENSENFQIREGGVSSQTQIINGSMTRKIVFNYVAIPKKEGVFTLGPAKLNFGRDQLVSNSVKIQVKKAESLGAEGERPFFLKTEVDNENPFVGEQIIYSFRLFVKEGADIRSLNLTSLPDFQGFWKEDLGKQKNYSTVINGVRWSVTELKMALFPMHEGTLSINGTSLEGQMIVADGKRRRNSAFDSFFDDGFFQRGTARPIHIESKPFNVTVKPLPSEGKPSDFSGLVGRFLIEGNVSKNRMKIGDSATLTFTIKGDGNIKDVKLPDLNLNEFKVYDDKPQLQIGGTDRLVGIKVIKKALVPIKEGHFTLPGLKISYFDTTEKSYRYLTTQDLNFEIAPGEKGAEIPKMVSVESENQNPNDLIKKKEIKLLGKDLMPLMKIEDAKSSRPYSFIELLILWILFLGSPIIYLLIFMWKKKRDRLIGDKSLLLSEKAFNLFKKREKDLSENSKEFFADGSKILREYLGHKLKLEGNAITPADADRMLGGTNLSPEIIEEIKTLLREFDMAQYGGLSQDKDAKINFRNKMVSIVKKVEKGVRV